MTRAERALLAVLLATLLFAPVFLGGVPGFSRDGSGAPPTPLERFLWADGAWWTLLLLGTAAAGLSLAVAAERRAAGEAPPWRLHRWILLPFAGLLLLALVQAAPLPRGLHALLSPGAARELDRLLPGDGAWRPLTLSPAGTRLALLGLGLGGSVLLGTLLVARRRGAALLLLGGAAAAFAGSALYGLASTFLGADTVLGFPKRQGAGVSGTFLNRSHLAAGAGAALCVSLGLLVPAARAALRGGTRERAAAAALAAAAAVAALAVPLSRSRMGLASAAAGVAVLGLLAARAVRWPPAAKAAVALAVLAAAGAGTAAAVRQVPALRERFALGATDRGFFDVRFPAWEATLRLAALHPVLGTGIGSYETAIHGTQTAANPDELVHAHAEPLEVLAEGGLAGLALAALLAAGTAAAVLAAAGAADPLARAAGCAAGGALAVLAVGSLTEFHLRIPALGVAAAVLAAVPAALAAGEPRPVPAAVPGRRAALALGALLLLLGGAAALAGTGDASLRGAAARAEQAGDPARWREAALAWTAASPGCAPAWRSRAGATVASEPGAALAAAERALDLEPFHAFGHFRRAEALLALGRVEEAVASFSRCLSRAGGIGHLHLAVGSLLLALSVDEPGLRPAACDALREAGRIVPQHFSRAWELADRLELPPADRESLVPDRAFAWEVVARHWNSLGEGEREVRAWARAAALAPREGKFREACRAAGAARGLEGLARSLLGEGGP